MNAELEQVLNLMPQPSFLVKDGHVVWRSAAARSLLPVGTPLAVLLEGGQEQYAAWTRSGTLQLPLRLFGKDFDACVQPLAHGDLFLADARAAAHASPAAAAMENLSCALCHPVHSLLNASRTLFERMQDKSDEQMMQAAAQLNRTVYQLNRLYTQLESGSRLLQHNAYPERLPTQMQDFLRSFAAEAQPLVQSAGRRFAYEPLSVPVCADVDTQLLSLALYNLLSNALHYTPPGGEIVLSAYRQRQFLHLALRDNGEGLSPEAAGSPFTRFAEQPVGDSRRSLGFGLPMVREIARAHGGTLVLGSGADGGTVVTLSLSTEPCAIKLGSRRLFVKERASLHPGLVALSDVLPPSAYRPDEVE